MTTITDLLPEYRNYLEHERKSAPATVRYYLYDLRELAAFWGIPASQPRWFMPTLPLIVYESP